MKPILVYEAAKVEVGLIGLFFVLKLDLLIRDVGNV
jgi:hypothetical protein